MNRAVMTLLSLSVAGSLLALLLFAGKQLFGKRLSRTFCYYVWLLVLARLVVPVSAPVNAMQLLSEKAQANSGLALTQNAPDHFAVSAGNGTGETFTSPQAAPSGPEPGATAAVSPWAFVKANLFWFWLAGALFCFGWFVSAYLVFAHRTMRSFTAPDPADAALFHELCKSRWLAFFCGDVGTPMLLGLFRPKIIVPCCAYVQSGRGGELRDILRHELTHFRRHDLLYKWAVIVVSSVHWFNPLLFWIRKEISRACELSCDETVIRDMSTIEKQRYGEMLLALSGDRRLSTGIPATTLCEEKKQLRERLLSIMRYRKRTAGTVVLSVLALAVLTGCASVLGGTSAKPSASPASETASMAAALLQNAAVYDANGYKLGIPKEYADQVLVFTDPPDDGALGKTLVRVSGKQSYEASGKNGVAHGGFLFAFERFTQGEYEQFLSQPDWSGMSIFAKDDQYYYCCGTATDMQFFPSTGTQLDENSAEYKQWLKLMDLIKPIEQDFIARNKLTVFSDNDVRSQPYTYDSKHLEIKYYPYYSINGSKDEYMRFVLSQPATQGDGGIWCVERFYDEKGLQYLWYPDLRYYEAVTGEKAGSETFTAADCYAAMQTLSDSGKDKSFLDPLSVAKKFTLNCGYWQSDAKLVDGSFEIVQS